MNQQYLKNLQQRAQKLLQISSQEEDLVHIQNQSDGLKEKQFEFNKNINQMKTYELQKELAQYKYTDIQLLKKCILLTTENNKLKVELQKQREKSEFVYNQLKQYKKQLKDSKKVIQGLQKTYRQELRSAKELQTYRHINLQKQQSSKRVLDKTIASPKFRNQINDEVSKVEQLQKLLQERNTKIQKLSIKLKNSKKENENLEKKIVNDKQKIKKLWNFIKEQIPKMRDIIIGLTQQVDSRLEKVLLKNTQNFY